MRCAVAAVSFLEMPGRKPESARRRAGAGARGGASDLVQLVIAYAKQETLDPVLRQLKALGRGIAGAVLLALGTVLLAVGFVRALETEFGSGRPSALAFGSAPLTRVITASPVTGAPVSTTPIYLLRSGGHLSGDWSWVPYMGGALFCVLVAGFCVLRIMKGASR